MNNLLSIIISIFKAGLISLFIVIGLYLIEKNSELIFFVKEFKSKKSIRHAEINHDRDQGYYFIITSIVYIYDLYKGYVEFTYISFIIWFAILITLSTIFGKIYDKYQVIDPNKADDDYTIN
jgi:hypothetical protein